MSESTIDRDYVYGFMRSQLSEILEIDADTITLDSSFSGDLKADSLALIELVESLEGNIRESKPDFRINDEDLVDLQTVGDAVDYVVVKVGN